jgi:hypothetical protein
VVSLSGASEPIHATKEQGGIVCAIQILGERRLDESALAQACVGAVLVDPIRRGGLHVRLQTNESTIKASLHDQ